MFIQTSSADGVHDAEIGEKPQAPSKHVQVCAPAINIATETLLMLNSFADFVARMTIPRVGAT